MCSEGYSTPSIWLSVYTYSRTTGYEAAYERYQQLQGNESMKSKEAIFLKRLHSRDMVWKQVKKPTNMRTRVQCAIDRTRAPASWLCWRTRVISVFCWSMRMISKHEAGLHNVYASTSVLVLQATRRPMSDTNGFRAMRAWQIIRLKRLHWLETIWRGNKRES